MVLCVGARSRRWLPYFTFNDFKRLLLEHIEIIVLLTFLLGYVSYVNYEKTLKYVVFASPQKSDFFYVDYLALNSQSDRYFRYIPMKVLKVDDKGIVFKVGNIAHSTPVSPGQHAKLDKAVLMRNYYKADNLFLSFSEIEKLIETGAIYNARRPQNVYIDGWIVIHEHEIMHAE